LQGTPGDKKSNYRDRIISMLAFPDWQETPGNNFNISLFSFARCIWWDERYLLWHGILISL